MNKQMTISLSREISKAATKKLSLEIAEKEQEITALVKKYELSKLPKAIKGLDESCTPYLKTSCVNLYLGGQYKDYVITGVPHKEGALYVTPGKTYDALEGLYNDIVDLNSSITESRNEIESTLKSLKSLKKIKEHFPEILPFIPNQVGVNLPVVNINKTRKLVSNINK